MACTTVTPLLTSWSERRSAEVAIVCVPEFQTASREKEWMVDDPQIRYREESTLLGGGTDG